MEERYQRLSKLWEKINLHKDNPVRWIQYLKETNDHEFIVQNIEVALAKMPFTKSAWKAYILYLKTVDIFEMLNVYSRYCHFFVDDWKMREMYRLEIVKLCRKEINVRNWANDYRCLNKELHIPVGYEYLFKII
uniref:Uncharacterized protein n=1 Tax=Panagrolaimus davidi TaxID=227884 RepID=A0A914PQ72_9BILA